MERARRVIEPESTDDLLDNEEGPDHADPTRVVGLIQALSVEWHESALYLEKAKNIERLFEARRETDRILDDPDTPVASSLAMVRERIDHHGVTRESGLATYVTLQNVLVGRLISRATSSSGPRAIAIVRLVVWLQFRITASFTGTMMYRIATSGVITHRNVVTLVATMSAEEILLGVAEDTGDAGERLMVTRTRNDPVWADWMELENRIMDSPNAARSLDPVVVEQLSERRIDLIDLEIALALDRVASPLADRRTTVSEEVDVQAVIGILAKLSDLVYQSRLGEKSLRSLLHNRDLRVTVTDRMVAQSRLLTERMADVAATDRLTGLPNRTMLDPTMDEARIRLVGDDTLALAVFDIAESRDLVRRYGSEGLDDVLRVVADRFRNELRSSDRALRIAGHRFAVVATIRRRDHAEPFLDRLLPILQAPIELDGDDIVPLLDVGIAVAELGDGNEAMRMRADADLVRRRQDEADDRAAEADSGQATAVETADGAAAETVAAAEPVMPTDDQRTESDNSVM